MDQTLLGVSENVVPLFRGVVPHARRASPSKDIRKETLAARAADIEPVGAGAYLYGVPLLCDILPISI